MASRERPITLQFLADVAQYLRETGKAEVSTEQLEDALVAVGNTGPELERKLERAMRDAERDVEKLERAIREIPDATDTAARQADADFHRIGDDARDAGREVGDEFKQNLGESLASGDISSIMQDTVGGLISGMSGPMGAAVGIIGGGALLVFNKIREHAEEMKAAIEETFSSMWGNVVDITGDAFGKIKAEMNVPALVSREFTRLWEEEPEGMKKLVEQAELFGIAATDVALARAGDEAAIQRVRAQMEAMRKDADYADVISHNFGAWKDVEDAITQGENALIQTKGTVDAYNASVAGLPQVWGTVQEAIDEAATGTDGVVDATKAAKIEAADINLDGMLDDTEIAIAKLQEIDAKTFGTKTIPVVFNFSDPFWAKQFSDPKSTYYNPGHAAIAASRNKYPPPP